MIDSKNDSKINFGLFLLLASYIYIFFVTLGYESAWMQPEVSGIKDSIIAAMDYENRFYWPLVHIFRFDEFEFAHRSTRLLSSLFEIADTTFRIHLWKIMTPHPSLSLTFIFTLFLTPYCLYRLLRNWELDDKRAKIAVSFYLVQPGTLSLLAMYFRPAKAMAIFFMMLSLYLASDIRKRYLSPGKTARGRTVCLFLSLFAGFFFDETAAIFYGVFFILCYDFVTWSKKNFMMFVSMPVIVFLLYFHILPFITDALHSSSQSLYGYAGQLFNKHLFLTLFVNNLFNNFRALFVESWGLFNPGAAPSIMLKIFFSVQILVLVSALAYFFFILFKKRKEPSLKREAYGLLTRILLVILLGVVAHAFLMSVVSNNVWGPYWYGSYMGVFFAFLIAGLYKINNRRFRQMVSVAAVSTIVVSMLTFPYLNFAYKKLHYYPYQPLYIYKIFRGQINRFNINRNSAPRGIKDAIQDIVLMNEKVPREVKIIRELLWLPIELGWFKKSLTTDSTSILDANHYLLLPYKTLTYDRDGNVYGKLDMYRKTVMECTMSIRQNPSYMTYYNRGTAYGKMHQYLRAIEDYDKAVAMKPDFADAYNNRGVAHFYSKNFEKGCRDAKKACDLGLCGLLNDVQKDGLCR